MPGIKPGMTAERAARVIQIVIAGLGPRIFFMNRAPSLHASWPGLARPSTSCAWKVVDARHKAGHDSGEAARAIQIVIAGLGPAMTSGNALPLYCLARTPQGTEPFHSSEASLTPLPACLH